MDTAYRFTYFNLDDNRKKCFVKHFASDESKQRYLESVLKKNIANLKIDKVYNPPPNKDIDLEREIVSKKRALLSGLNYVYALIDEEKVVYIGMTGNIMQRLSFHINSSKKFTHFSIVESSESLEYIRTREAEYIRAIKPKYNKALTGDLQKQKPMKNSTRIVWLKSKN